MIGLILLILGVLALGGGLYLIFVHSILAGILLAIFGLVILGSLGPARHRW